MKRVGQRQANHCIGKEAIKEAIRRKHLTVSALICSIQKWTARKEAVIASFDYSAAFDTNDKNTVQQRLEDIGAHDNVKTWMNSYMSGESTGVDLVYRSGVGGLRSLPLFPSFEPLPRQLQKSPASLWSPFHWKRCIDFIFRLFISMFISQV